MFGFEKDFYQNLFESLDNNSVLMRVGENGAYEPVWCSGEYAEMMEGTKEECIQRESEEENDLVHPADREEVSYLFKNQVTKDGTNNLTVRKKTLQGKNIWVNVHYAFVKEGGVQYAYCTYIDVTELIQSQKQTMALSSILPLCGRIR